MLKMKFFACLCLAATLGCAADREQVPLGPIDSPSAVAKSIPALARDVMAVYREADRRLFLDKLFRLHLAAGDDEAAAKTIESLRAQEAGDSSLVARTRHLDAARSGKAYRLSEKRPAGGDAVTLTVNLADRTDVDRVDADIGMADTIDRHPVGPLRLA